MLGRPMEGLWKKHCRIRARFQIAGGLYYPVSREKLSHLWPAYLGLNRNAQVSVHPRQGFVDSLRHGVPSSTVRRRIPRVSMCTSYKAIDHHNAA
jgi:hypothetical protein